MRKVENVKKYAKQLLKNVDIEEIPQAIEQLGNIARLMEEDKEIRTFMVSPSFTGEERQKIISHISHTLGISDKVIKYLLYLSDKRVIGAMPDIVRSIITLYLEMKKRAKAVITVPVQVSREYEKELVGFLRKITGRDIDFELDIDPSIIGGIYIKVGSTVYDSSIKGQLRSLKDKLIIKG
ncbi:MAG: ATP synthase F1 subunit delta [Thermodesulfovibrionales bacterium]|nr:ATP synthase F1 subunit delta [Thermodesulfovibrionales bacterium]